MRRGRLRTVRLTESGGWDDPFDMLRHDGPGETGARRGGAADRTIDAIDALRALHERTNCVAAWNDSALATARALDAEPARGPLHGVPFTVKDWIDAAGLPCSGGSRRHRDRLPAVDATAVARLRGAGAVLIAKTTVQVDSPLFGPVLNPRDRARSPGGSSSGAAVSVGGGAVPLALASDSGGSIRIPAAWCGAVGFKPTFSRVPVSGHFPVVGDRQDGRTQIGPITSSVALARRVLDVAEGPDGLDPACAPVVSSSSPIDFATLRVGYCLGDDRWKPSAVNRRALESAIDVISARGARVVGEVPMELARALDITQRYWRRSLLTGDECAAQLADWDDYRRRAAADWPDILLAPATADVAPLHRDMTEEDYAFALPASLTGAPALVVPIADNGSLPASVQIVARPWRDDLALVVGEALEAA
jgi:Asp-tRNA(Asn)/Glu-tRNA(Gln) amidotransferase A subunit family amidase